MVIEQAKLSDIEELYALQLLAFESEAEMIGSGSVPALMESFEQARDDFSRWNVLKAVENGAIIGAVVEIAANGSLEFQAAGAWKKAYFRG